MKEILPTLLSNFYGFDMVIFAVALINLIIYFRTRTLAGELYNILHPTAKAKHTYSEATIVDMRHSTTSAYSLYLNVSAIFPLLGILGTVLSLLNMAKDMQNMQTNFFAALTSTFWGLIFAIFYKLVDSKVAALIEDNEKNVAFYLERGERENRKITISKERD